MSEEALIDHCSPTLAGIKTGNLFRLAYATKGEMTSSVRGWNKSLRDKGLRVVPLEYRDGYALLYVYRPALLSGALLCDGARELLCERGYSVEFPDRCVACLAKRLAEQRKFPHEIGLFLGYPPEDVRGFIENRQSCKTVGAWKVYGDVNRAEKTFKKYKKCAEIYKKAWREGRSVEQLTVSV